MTKLSGVSSLAILLSSTDMLFKAIFSSTIELNISVSVFFNSSESNLRALAPLVLAIVSDFIEFNCTAFCAPASLSNQDFDFEFYAPC